jgi:hypothetical protein
MYLRCLMQTKAKSIKCVCVFVFWIAWVLLSTETHVDRNTQKAETTNTQIHLKVDNEDQNKCVYATSEHIIDIAQPLCPLCLPRQQNTHKSR